MGNDKFDVKSNLENLEEKAAVQNDSQFNKPTSKEKHEDAYTKILDAYAADIVETLEKKSIYKSHVFWLSFSLLVGVSLLIVYLLRFKTLSTVTEWCMVVLPALVSFLTVFFVIPKIITEYLFNSEEEKYMSEIIKNIQNYDKKDNE